MIKFIMSLIPGSIFYLDLGNIEMILISKGLSLRTLQVSFVCETIILSDKSYNIELSGHLFELESKPLAYIGRL